METKVQTVHSPETDKANKTAEKIRGAITNIYQIVRDRLDDLFYSMSTYGIHKNQKEPNNHEKSDS